MGVGAGEGEGKGSSSMSEAGLKYETPKDAGKNMGSPSKQLKIQKTHTTACPSYDHLSSNRPTPENANFVTIIILAFSLLSL